MNDEDCLKAIASGGRAGQKAVSTLYERYARRFLGYLTRRRVSVEDAEDLVQDVFVKVVSSVQGSTKTIENGRAFLYRSLHNRFVDHLRAKKPNVSEGDLGSEGTTDSGFEMIAGNPGIENDETGFLLCFQGALREFYRDNQEAGTVIDLAVIEGFSGKELAEVLDRTYGATREFLSQCKKKFQRLLAELCYDYMPESAGAGG